MICGICGIVRRQPVGVRLREGPIGHASRRESSGVSEPAAVAWTGRVDRSRAGPAPRYLLAVFRAGPCCRSPCGRPSCAPVPSRPAPCVRPSCGPVPSWPGRSWRQPERRTCRRRRRRRRSVGNAPFTSFGCRGRGQDGVLERLHRRDARLLRSLDPDGLTGGRVATHARRHGSTLTNLAKPGMETGSPFETTAVTTSVNPSMTVTTVFNSTSDWTATAFASSRLFMAPIVADAHP